MYWEHLNWFLEYQNFFAALLIELIIYVIILIQ